MSIRQHDSHMRASTLVSRYLSAAFVVVDRLLSAACVSPFPEGFNFTPLLSAPCLLPYLSEESDTGLPLLRKQPW